LVLFIPDVLVPVFGFFNIYHVIVPDPVNLYTVFIPSVVTTGEPVVYVAALYETIITIPEPPAPLARVIAASPEPPPPPPVLADAAFPTALAPPAPPPPNPPKPATPP
jgi:hypothetical protein